MPRIKSYRSEKIEVRKSEIEGSGVFAKEDINKGELVFIKGGHVVDYSESKRLDRKFGDYSLQITDDFFICPTTMQEVEDTSFFVNHSCNPNVGIDGQITFYALRDIKKGEEIALDYATITAHEYKLKCNCGSENCRGKITGDDWKQKRLQRKYKSHFSYFIIKKIKQEKLSKETN